MRTVVNNFTKNLQTTVGTLKMTVLDDNRISIYDLARNKPSSIDAPTININGVNYKSLSMTLERRENGWYVSYCSMYRVDSYNEPTRAARNKIEAVALEAVKQWERYYTAEVNHAHNIYLHNELAIHYRTLAKRQEELEKLQAEIAELTATIEAAEPITPNVERQEETAAIA